MSTIAICSDSHDNLPNIQKFLKFCQEQNIKTILHCGDISSLKTFNYIQDHFDKEIHAVEGNADQINLPKKQIIQIENLKIGLAHRKNTAKNLLIKNPDLKFIFYGHTHKPWIEQMNNTYLANPGTLAGMFYKASFAILDTKTKKLELKLCEEL